MRATAQVWAIALIVVVSGLTPLAGVSAQAAAQPAGRGTPLVTRVSPGAGPATPRTIALIGRNLRGADAVRFGAKRGKVLRVVSASKVKVRSPRGLRPGVVPVRVHTRAGWSRPTKASRYRVIGRPALRGISPATGSYEGGQRITLTGTQLATAKRVRFGGVNAKILRRTDRRVVVTSPLGVLGAVPVTVKTLAGTSRGRTFTYVRPSRQDSATVVPASGTFTATAADWVTGGPDADEGTSHPWVVGLPAGSDVPAIGQQFYLAPGTTAAPAGLAGTVEDVAVQTDESVRVTVSATDLDQALDRVSIDYSGPLLASTGAARRSAETAVEWPIGGSSLFCHDQQGNSVAFGAELTMRVSDVDVSQHLDLGGLFHKPSYDGTFTAEVTTTGTFHGEAASTCSLRPEWQNANRRVFPIGTTGLTVSFAPAIEFSVSAKGTLRILDRTRTTFAVDARLGESPRFSKTSRTVEHSIGGALTFSASLAGGVSVQFGLLDRAGLQGKVMLALSAELEASSDPNVCVTGKISLKLSVNVFLDAWVARWESPSLTATIDLYQLARYCVRAETETPPTNEPQIVSTRLPDAQIGTSYDEWLETADGRTGTWSVVRNPLPAGLSLDPDTGEIYGTPTGPVDDYPVIIDFTDSDGLVATTTIRIQVLPESGIGGGDVQVTLRWTGPADLDLHVIDPAGEEIYYGNDVSASGGQLDHDANAGCNGPADDDNAVENIFWPAGQAPVGSYAARVVVYAVCDGPLSWHLIVRRGGQVVVDQTGTGDSEAFPFSVGSASAAGAAGSTGSREWLRSYPAK